MTIIIIIIRINLSSPTIRNILKRCGHIFLAGQGESAMITSSLLSMGPLPTPPLPEPIIEEKKEVNEDDDDDPFAKYATKRPVEEVKDTKPKIIQLKVRGEDIDETPDDQPSDKEVPAIGSIIRSSRQKSRQATTGQTDILEEFRLLLFGAMARLSRRVYWSYFRQLWDFEYNNLIDEDDQGEVLHRNLFQMRKTLAMKKNLQTCLQETKLKILREFGEEYTASDRIAARVRIIDKEVSNNINE